ncbi:MAG: glycosyltransferase family 2 protein [Burkholderiales bacterium]
MMKIAVLMACFNRREKTLACLAALMANALSKDHSIHVILADDGSTDGTAAAVLARYPDAQIISGDGSWFWNGGMHKAFERAMQGGYDAYLWLNDDTNLYPDTLMRLFDTWRQAKLRRGADAIVVGSTQDPGTLELTYGGVVRAASWRPLTFRMIEPGDRAIECESMWGNCVLIPAAVALAIGNLDPRFKHSMGDVDYGLRARKAGFGIFVMPGFAGTCSTNSPKGTFEDARVPLIQRLRKIAHPKGMPIDSWRVLTRRHAGPLWFLYWVWPYFKVIATSIVRR